MRIVDENKERSNDDEPNEHWSEDGGVFGDKCLDRVDHGKPPLAQFQAGCIISLLISAIETTVGQSALRPVTRGIVQTSEQSATGLGYAGNECLTLRMKESRF